MDSDDEDAGQSIAKWRHEAHVKDHEIKILRRMVENAKTEIQKKEQTVAKMVERIPAFQNENKGFSREALDMIERSSESSRSESTRRSKCSKTSRAPKPRSPRGTRGSTTSACNGRSRLSSSRKPRRGTWPSSTGRSDTSRRRSSRRSERGYAKTTPPPPHVHSPPLLHCER